MAASPDSAPALVVVRTIAAPVAEVFAAWTDAALLQRWLAPTPYTVLEAAADARPGGTYRIVVVDPEGKRHTTTGEYREVVPGRRLVKTWDYQSPDPASDLYPTLLTVDFREAAPDVTELTIRQEGLRTPADRAGNREGWRLCLDNLEALVGARATER